MVPLDIRRQQLSNLTEAIDDLLGVLRCDPRCKWTEHFEKRQREIHKLLGSKFTQEQLSGLSVSICRLLRRLEGPAPRNFDAETGKYRSIPGTENYETFARVAAERALELRVIGRY